MPKNSEKEGRSAVMCVIRDGEKCVGVEIAETSTREAELMAELSNEAYRRGKRKESSANENSDGPLRNRMEKEQNGGGRK